MTPPATKFTRQDVLGAALQIIRTEGDEHLSARRIASELKCTVAPIYRIFSSMEELITEVLEVAYQELIRYASVSYTTNRFLNVGAGIVILARDEPLLFHYLFTNMHNNPDFKTSFIDYTVDTMEFQHLPAELDVDQKKKLLEDIWLYTAGVAYSVFIGYFEELSDRQILKMLFKAGGIFSMAMFLYPQEKADQEFETIILEDNARDHTPVNQQTDAPSQEDK